ncbi:hypothetical protein [Acinetobacter soli]|uniref:hypothetical protein n=1 Tax=Acinetobacter soli TaxID=487316 RepID=UPI003AA85FC3
MKQTIPFPIVPNKTGYERTSDFKNLKINVNYLVWWFGGISKMHHRKTIITSFQVIFREVIEQNTDNTVVGNFVLEHISLSSSSRSFRIGDIWSRNKYHSAQIEGKINLPVFSLTTSFDESNWYIRKVNEEKDINSDIQAFLEFFPLPNKVRDTSKFLELGLENKQKLFINNIAFLVASYEKVSFLMTYPFISSHPTVKTITNLLIRPIKLDKPDGKWRVFSSFESECIFLAHFKYDPYTQKVIKKLTNQRIKAWLKIKSDDDIPTFYPSIQPWYTDDKVEIKVQGFLCNGNIIGLNILSISNPKGSIIEWHSPIRKMGKQAPSINRVVHIDQLNKQLRLPLNELD